MKKSAQGFTLVELLVVITIMAIIGVVAFSNLGSFGEDQKLKNAAQDVISFLRLAQSNASTGLKCQIGGITSGGVNWLVAYTNSAALDLKCQNLSGTSNPIKTLTFPTTNISVDRIVSGTCNPNEIIFTNLTGTMTSKTVTVTNTTTCNSNPVTITLKDVKISSNSCPGSNCKQVIIEPGGRIYGP